MAARKDKKMRKYDINTLDQKIEKIVKKTVEYYYTDWKNYDRPKYMKLKGDSSVKNITLIARKCGTYLFSDKEIASGEAAAFLEYYTTQEAANFYNIDMVAGSVKLTHKGIA